MFLVKVFVFFFLGSLGLCSGEVERAGLEIVFSISFNFR